MVLTAYDHGGDGPDLVLGHATGFHARYWDPIVSRISHRYRCIAIDFRGHGESTLGPGSALDWWTMAGDLLAVIDHLGLRDVMGVGHSMGGACTVMAEITRPGTFSRAWLFEPILFPAVSNDSLAESNVLAKTARRRREVFASRDAAYTRYASRPPFSRVDPEALRAYVDWGFEELDDGTVRLRCRAETEARTFEGSATGAFERIHEVATAATVAGSGDGNPPALVAPEIADRIPNGRYEPYPDLTHFAPMEDPDRVAAAIVASLG
jgi:pimeloyl-ACP methyl ester carboxylesterase